MTEGDQSLLREEPKGLSTGDRALMLLALRKYKTALPLFADEAQEHLQDPDFVRGYAEALVGTGGRENITKAIGILQTTLTAKEDEVTGWLHMGLAEAYARRGAEGDYDRARTEYERAYNLHPETLEVPFSDIKAQEKLQERGAEQYAQRNYLAALSYWGQALALKGEQAQPGIVFDKGKAFLALGQTEGAIQEFERTRDLLPNESFVSSQLGTAYALHGELGKADKAYDQALRLDQENYEALEHRNVSIRFLFEQPHHEDPNNRADIEALAGEMKQAFVPGQKNICLLEDMKESSDEQGDSTERDRAAVEAYRARDSDPGLLRKAQSLWQRGKFFKPSTPSTTRQLTEAEQKQLYMTNKYKALALLQNQGYDIEIYGEKESSEKFVDPDRRDFGSRRDYRAHLELLAEYVSARDRVVADQIAELAKTNCHDTTNIFVMREPHSKDLSRFLPGQLKLKSTYHSYEEAPTEHSTTTQLFKKLIHNELIELSEWEEGYQENMAA